MSRRFFRSCSWPPRRSQGQFFEGKERNPQKTGPGYLLFLGFAPKMPVKIDLFFGMIGDRALSHLGLGFSSASLFLLLLCRFVFFTKMFLVYIYIYCFFVFGTHLTLFSSRFLLSFFLWPSLSLFLSWFLICLIFCLILLYFLVFLYYVYFSFFGRAKT